MHARAVIAVAVLTDLIFSHMQIHHNTHAAWINAARSLNTQFKEKMKEKPDAAAAMH